MFGIFWLAGLFIWLQITLLLQYSACLPERHGLFLRLRLLRGRRSAAGPARWPRRRRPTPPAASRLGPARLALPGLSSPLPAPLASPWSAAGLPSPLAAACPLSRCLTGTLSLLSFCSPSFICRAPGLYCLSASLSLSLSLSLSPRPRSVVRRGPEAAARYRWRFLAGSALAVRFSAAAPARAGSAAPTAASEEPLAPPPLRPPPPSPALPHPDTHADRELRDGTGARSCPAALCVWCVGRLCMSVCPSVRVASRTPAPSVALPPQPLPISPSPARSGDKAPKQR